ncbi:hypothetical protein F5Y03DRAFT_326129 [Xylaria venustula]|nr:hypothetical protein F5Y03DRAFT_326129 [Xylaria venustula]
MTSTASPYHINLNNSEPSLRAPTLPPYTEHAGTGEDIELVSLSPSTTSSSQAAPTRAAEASSSSSPISSTFTPTKQLQLQTPGKNFLSLPSPTRPDPIPIFTLTATGTLDRPLYLSIRPQTRSGSCFLTYADDETQAPLTTTTYRFGYGPGRRPIIALGNPTRNPPLTFPSHGQPPEAGSGVEEEGETGKGIEIAGRSLFSRAIRFHVPGLGSFGWRYGDSAERGAASADSLLVCEVFHDNDATDYQKTKKRKNDGKGHRIAQLVRNEQFRSPGSSRSSAGNGGRLMLDLSIFEEKVRERVEWLVVTTAVAMLKREVDRRRAQQIAAIGVLAST